METLSAVVALTPSLSCYVPLTEMAAASEPHVSVPLDLSVVTSWEYCPLGDDVDIRAHFVAMLTADGLHSQVGASVEQIVALFDGAKQLYHAHPYHCFVHAIDVVQAVFAMLTLGGAREALVPVEQFALLVAALCHDLDHPGFTNEFATMTKHPIALEDETRNDVLEKHHVRMAHELLNKPGVDLLGTMGNEQRERFVEVCDAAILATFMADHNKYMDAFKEAQSKCSLGVSNCPKFRLVLSQIILKAADIFNQARPHAIACKWSVRFQEETWEEGDLRLSKGLELGMFMDRENPVKLSQMQVGFIDFFVKPLLEQLAITLPGVLACVEELLKTRATWVAISESESDA